MIGSKITSSRLNLNMSQTELAMRARTSLRTIQQIEEGCLIPDSDLLFNLSSILDIPIVNLIETTISMDSKTAPPNELT